jgi:phosphoribosyl 1,2-cyclic phosphodiesterase
MGSIDLRFWGARGGVAVPGADTLRYGGNTSCVELRCGEHVLILDAGTGLRSLGGALVAQGGAVDADLLLSHTHLDHIIGLAFFAPLFIPGTKLRIHGGHLPEAGLQAALTASLSAPLMPDLLAVARAQIDIRSMEADVATQLRPGLAVTAAHLHHPGGSVGFRITWRGKVVAYVTDTEHTPGAPDPQVLRLAEAADILIYDANFTDAEFSARRGWGHSTWQEGVRLADAAGVGRLVLFHHDPARTDSEMDAIAHAAAEARPGTLAAAEGLTLAV